MRQRYYGCYMSILSYGIISLSLQFCNSTLLMPVLISGFNPEHVINFADYKITISQLRQ